MQEDIVARLTGHRAIEPGVTLADRYGTMNRARARIYIEAELTKLGYEVRQQHFESGTNLIAKLNAPTSAFFLIGAHYDSRPGSAGAIRNATAVAALLASARYLAEQQCRRRDIVFALFDQDYSSQSGSRVLARSLLSEKAGVLGVVLLDQLGVDLDGDLGLETHSSSPAMRALLTNAREHHTLESEVSETTRLGLGHQVFQVLGIPGMTLTQEIVEEDIQPSLDIDDYRMVNFSYLAESTAVLNALLSDLSTLPRLEVE